MGHWRSQRQWEEARRDAEALIRDGNSVSEVARALDVDRSTIGRWMTLGGFRLQDLEREGAGEPPLRRPDWVLRDLYRKAAGTALPPEYAERVARAQEELAAAAKDRVALMRERGGKLAVPEVDAEAFARRAVAEAERRMGEGLYDLAERSMRIAERLARVKGLLGGAGAGERAAPERSPVDQAQSDAAVAQLRERLALVVEHRRLEVEAMRRAAAKAEEEEEWRAAERAVADEARGSSVGADDDEG